MYFFIIIGGIIILILVLNLRGRVKILEAQIKAASMLAAPAPSYPYQPQQATQTQGQQAVVTPVPAPPVESSGPSGFEKFGMWLKEDWMLKLGALLLLIGFGWLTTYAFLNNWIGPMGRIALGIIAGAMFLVLGWWRIKKYIHQGGIFLVLGSTTVLITLFAGREIYDFFTPLSALIVMFLSTAFVALASVKYNSRSLALASLILAGVAPLLTNSPSQNYIGLFSYLFVVTLGAIWIVILTGRRELTTAALVIITLYSLPYFSSFISKDESTLLLFAYAFTIVFFITNTFGILKLKGKEIIPDLITAAGNGLFLLLWIMTAADDEWKSLFISAWMVVFAAGAFLTFKITQRREPFYVYAGVAIAMLAAATSAELKGATLVIAYAVECGVISLITYFIMRDIRVAERMNLLFIGPMILSVESIMSRSWSVGVFQKDFFVLFCLGILLLGLGTFFLNPSRANQSKEPKEFNILLLIFGSIYMYVLIWLSLEAALENNDTAVMISLLVYTMTGLVTYFMGLFYGKKSLRIYGGLLLGFVVCRMLLIDVWRMELAGRIVTFFLIGALLISTAFIGRKKIHSVPSPQ